MRWGLFVVDKSPSNGRKIFNIRSVFKSSRYQSSSVYSQNKLCIKLNLLYSLHYGNLPKEKKKLLVIITLRIYRSLVVLNLNWCTWIIATVRACESVNVFCHRLLNTKCKAVNDTRVLFTRKPYETQVITSSIKVIFWKTTGNSFLGTMDCFGINTGDLLFKINGLKITVILHGSFVWLLFHANLLSMHNLLIC